MAATAEEWLCAFWWAFVGACALGSGAAPSWARRAVGPLVARGKVEAAREEGVRGGGGGGPTAKAWATAYRVPHAWFKHFYVVGCCVNAIALTRSSANAGGGASDASRLALGLFQVHLIRRLYESAFVSSYRAGASMHAVSYALGLAYYVCASQSWAWRPPPTASGGGLLDFDGGASETNGGGAAAAGGTTAGVLLLALKCIGVVLFAVGNREQHRCHVILAESRRAKSSRSARTKQSYVIPRGGWFERFSCAHYTAEIVIYLGLLTIVLPPRIALIFINHPDRRHWRLVLRVVAAPASMCLAVCANLTLAARSHHAWYLDAFGEDYPRHRTAIFPSLSFRLHPKPSFVKRR